MDSEFRLPSGTSFPEKPLLPWKDPRCLVETAEREHYTLTYSRNEFDTLTLGATLSGNFQVRYRGQCYLIHAADLDKKAFQAFLTEERYQKIKEGLSDPDRDFFPEVVGQSFAKKQLKNNFVFQALPAGLLFLGPSSVGKWSAALSFVRIENCAGGFETNCHCKSCQQTRAGNHPALRIIEPTATNVIPVEAIREALEELRWKHDSCHRFVLIRRADRMNAHAVNAVLKLLEEPPEKTSFLLTSSKELPETIVSRCQIIRFTYLADAELLALTARDQVSADELKIKLMAGSYQPDLKTDVIYLRSLWDPSAADFLPDKLDVKVLRDDLQHFAAALGLMARSGIDTVGALSIPRVTPEKISTLLGYIDQALGFLERGVKPYVVLQWILNRCWEAAK